MSRATRLDVPSTPRAFYEWSLEQGWGDGLPLLPPDEDVVEQCCQASGREPDDVVAVIDPVGGVATVEKLAAYAVMAGCLPNYMPILITAFEALVEPQVNLHGLQCTTNPAAPMLIVNGPIRHELGIACGADALGPGHRANQTIGRAIRLVLRNIGGGIPPTDRSTLGSPWKMGLVLGENEELSPWAPLHVDLGYEATDSVVTVVNVESMTNIFHTYTTVEGTLMMLAHALSFGVGAMGGHAHNPLALSPGHARVLADGGLTKEDVRAELFERAKITRDFYPPEGGMATEPLAEQDDGRYLVIKAPEEIYLLVAGADEPFHSMYFCGWSASLSASRKL
jgi:hypothetical protein